MSQPKRWALCLVSSSLLLIYLATSIGCINENKAQVLPTTHATKSPNQFQTGSIEKLQELLLKRYDILKAIVDHLKREINMGHGEISELRSATVRMIRAESDLYSSNSERVKVYEKLIATLRKQEKSIARMADSDQATRTDALRAKVAILEAQIDLEKLRLARKTSE
jgi:hypothetical protein